MAFFKKKEKEQKEQPRYPSPILLLAAAVYVGYMAYCLWKTIADGSATGNSLIISWVGMIVFAILAVGLAYVSFRVNKLSKQALDEEIAREQAELEALDFDNVDDADEDNNND